MSDQQTIPALEPDVRDRVAAALRDGGRARVTVTSRKTGKHLTLRLACKGKGEDGRFISRARIAGRVGFDEADAVFCDGADSAFSGWIATLYPKSGQWFTPPSWDDPRGASYFWAARRVIHWALNGDEEFAAQASVDLAEECSHCGRPLNDPVSISRGVGPECYGRSTGSVHA